MRNSRPTIAWYSLDRRTASGSTTSLASYTNPPVSAAPARVVRSGRDTRYERDSTDRTPALVFIWFIGRLLWFSIAFWPVASQESRRCARTISRPTNRHMRRRIQIGCSYGLICDRQEALFRSLLCYRPQLTSSTTLPTRRQAPQSTVVSMVNGRPLPTAEIIVIDPVEEST